MVKTLSLFCKSVFPYTAAPEENSITDEGFISLTSVIVTAAVTARAEESDRYTTIKVVVTNTFSQPTLTGYYTLQAWSQ